MTKKEAIAEVKAVFKRCEELLGELPFDPSGAIAVIEGDEPVEAEEKEETRSAVKKTTKKA